MNQEPFDRDAVHRSDELVAARAAKCAVALIVEQGDNVRQHGCGTLFRIGDSFFIVTAAHVIRTASMNGYRLFIMNAETPRVIAPPLDVVISADSPGEIDFRDVGAWRIDKETVALLRGAEFLDLTDIDLAPATPEQRYFFYGLPTEMSDAGVRKGKPLILRPLRLHTSIYEGPTDDFETYRKPYHILLNAQRGGIVDLDGQLGLDFPERLNGISGCSIWRTLKSKDAKRSTEAAKVVAVETHFYEKAKVVRGTNWNSVLSLLVMRWPELEQSLSLFLPSRLRK